ncbi:hypothetical protein ACLKA6_017516 [Drosophila palustris]
MSGFYQPIPGEESARLFPFNADVSTRIHVQIAEASEKTLPSTEQHKNTSTSQQLNFPFMMHPDRATCIRAHISVNSEDKRHWSLCDVWRLPP